MRIQVAYATAYHYDRPIRQLVQLLKLTPRAHEGQRVASWTVDVEPDGKLWRHEDPLGNIAHTLYVSQPASRLVVSVAGEVETTDTAGVVRGTVERFPDTVFLRTTPLTEPDTDLIAFAHDTMEALATDPLQQLHALMGAVHGRVRFDVDATHAATTAAEAFKLGSGVCQDLTHIFIAAARRLGRPCRYVSGHLAYADGRELEAAHAWAEALVPELGWVGFDPTNNICPTENYLRVAVGLDYLDAAPVRGARYGGGQEVLEVRLTAADAAPQA